MRRTLGTAAAVAAFALAAAASAADSTTPAKDAVATFASGCFWCTEPDFEAVPGVTSVDLGLHRRHRGEADLPGGRCGGTGHAEAVEVHYDPSKVTYQKLLDVFWHNTDPLDSRGQFCDKGDAVPLRDLLPRRRAEAARRGLEGRARAGAPLRQPTIVTKIVPAGPFYPAEEYHQDYYKKNPVRYKFYRWNCGRDQRLTELWGADAGGAKVAMLEPPEQKPRRSARDDTNGRRRRFRVGRDARAAVDRFRPLPRPWAGV